ncbi:GNAT family N-acetyltransferase [Streptomyces sp. NPDC094038]|uniref:GNAT family N-acetyltransferase n=1 Tax=Streptomyces sp. NPDC094038 TaxID=3366055 RepID=UPI00382EEC50
MTIDVGTLSADDWALWRRLRLRALTESPEVYASALADWTGPQDTEERWRGRLTDVPFNAVLWHGDRAVGMVSGTAPGADGLVELISLWVAPEARGRGLGDAAVGAVLAWARRTHPGRAVALSVRLGNNRAADLFRRNGFVDAAVAGGERDERRMLHRPRGT